MQRPMRSTAITGPEIASIWTFWPVSFSHFARWGRARLRDEDESTTIHGSKKKKPSTARSKLKKAKLRARRNSVALIHLGKSWKRQSAAYSGGWTARPHRSKSRSSMSRTCKAWLPTALPARSG